MKYECISELHYHILLCLYEKDKAAGLFSY